MPATHTEPSSNHSNNPKSNFHECVLFQLQSLPASPPLGLYKLNQLLHFVVSLQKKISFEHGTGNSGIRLRGIAKKKKKNVEPFCVNNSWDIYVTSLPRRTFISGICQSCVYAPCLSKQGIICVALGEFALRYRSLR